MARYIDADLITESCKRQEKDEWNKKAAPSSWSDAYEQFETDISYIPTSDVEPVVHAHWIRASNKPYVNAGLKCSHCKVRISYSERMGGNHLYCYKCGAHMDEQEKPE